MNNQLTVEQYNEGVRQLAQSSRDLAARFGQQRTVAGQLALIREELNEVMTAEDDTHRVEELCDLIVVWHGLYDANFPCTSAYWTHSGGEYPFIKIAELPGEYGFQTVQLDEFATEVNHHIGYVIERNGSLMNSWILVPILILRLLRTISNAAELFQQQVAHVVAKNEAKTPDTHYLDAVTGKITRKAAQS